MNQKMNRLSLAVRVGLTAGLITGAGMAQAQQPATPGPQPAAAAAPQPQSASTDSQAKGKIKTLQAMVVTGSLIRRVDLETASPVVKIDREDIANSGKPTLGDVLQQLPSIAGNATNTHNNSNGGGVASPLTEGGDGASRVSLRGLGTGRTLVLIDGQRMLNADMNLIPESMIERVDVLATGASTTYGSDAVGGVVNFVLRKHFEGAEITLTDGLSSHHDGQRHGFELTLGHSGDKYSIVGGVGYNKYDALPATRRDFSKAQLYLYGGQVVVAGSSSIPSGRMQVPTDTSLPFNQQFGNCARAQVTLATGDGTSMNDYRCRTGDDTFNYAAFNYIQVSQQRSNAFVLGNFDLTDNISAFVDAFYNHTSSAGQDAAIPVGTGDGLIIPASAPFNPFGVTFSQNKDFPGDPLSGYTFQTRLTSFGTRLHPYTTSTGQAIAGLKGAFGESSWLWNVTFDYGHTARTQRDENELSIPDLQAAIDSGFNIFNQINQPGFSTGAVTATYQKFESLRQLSAGAGGNLFDLPAGPMQLSVGALVRKQTMNYTVDPFAVLDPVTANCPIVQEACGSPGRGSDVVREVYGETLIPLLKDAPGAKSLNIDVGVRYSDYDSAGSTTNWKLAVEWRPIEDLLVRGTATQVFRAPNLDQLYDGRSIVQPNLNDPCVNLTSADLLQHQNACQYVPAGWGGNDIAQVNTYYSGSTVLGMKLKPEHGKSMDFGFVYAPHWAPGLNTSVDFWHIYLYDTLEAITGPNVVTTCFNNDASPLCAFIHRQNAQQTANPGQVFVIDTPVMNLGTLSTSGVDFTVNYKIPHFNFGSVNPGDFAVGLATSYLSTFKNNAVPNTPGATTIDYAGTLNKQFGNIARWRGTLSVNWKRDRWDAQWRTRYISSVTALDADAITHASIPQASVVYNDLQVGYAMPSLHTRLDAGVDNLFGKKPPLYYQNGQMNVDTATYDMVGTYFWARATLKF